MCAIVSLFTDIFILFYKKRLARSHFFCRSGATDENNAQLVFLQGD